jgi:hypothetical protein
MAAARTKSMNVELIDANDVKVTGALADTDNPRNPPAVSPRPRSSRACTRGRSHGFRPRLATAIRRFCSPSHARTTACTTGHARKMAAKLQAMGYEAYFYEPAG